MEARRRLASTCREHSIPARARAGRFELEAEVDGTVNYVLPGRVPDPQAAPLTLAASERAITKSWCRETSDDPDEWTPARASRGQCAVSALLIRDFLGGEILIAPVLREGVATGEHHAWNRLPSGVEIDITRDQFDAGETFGTPEVRTPSASVHGRDRYLLLRDSALRLAGHCPGPRIARDRA